MNTDKRIKSAKGTGSNFAAFAKLRACPGFAPTGGDREELRNKANFE
jgi:hypothetical protein